MPFAHPAVQDESHAAAIGCVCDTGSTDTPMAMQGMSEITMATTTGSMDGPPAVGARQMQPLEDPAPSIAVAVVRYASSALVPAAVLSPHPTRVVRFPYERGYPMKYASSVVDLIGGTPLLALDRINATGSARVLGKCEFLNPIAIKDRPVSAMIREAERRGEIRPGTTLIEATSGNTGMALAYIGGLRGYRVVLCMSEIQSVERRRVLQALGAELHLTPGELGTKGAKARALELHASTPGSFYVGQHDNPDNRLAHVETTGPEIWEDTAGKVDVFVAPLGTGGTLCGVSEALKARKPEVRIVGVEPEEAPFISRGAFRPHRMMGTAPGFVPGILDTTLIDEIRLVSEEDAFQTCRELARTEGILVGISSGASVCTALRLAREPDLSDRLIVCMLCDSGERYLSVEGLF
jgi:cysteine synthase A